jgi:hypothetical protein
MDDLTARCDEIVSWLLIQDQAPLKREIHFASFTLSADVNPEKVSCRG